MNIQVWRILGASPLTVPAGRTIFNAPRPIYGQLTWNGDYRHGRFYTAIDPSDGFVFRGNQTLSQKWAEGNAELDAWVLIFVDDDTAIADCWAMASESGVDPGGVGMDWSKTVMTRDMIECWNSWHRYADVDTDVVLAVNSLEALGATLGLR